MDVSVLHIILKVGDLHCSCALRKPGPSRDTEGKQNIKQAQDKHPEFECNPFE